MKMDDVDPSLARRMAERRVAIGCVVMGASFGALLVVLTLAEWLLRLFKLGLAQACSTSYLTYAGVLMLLTMGIWKRILAAPIIGAVLAAADAVWFFSRGNGDSALL
jgi:hypothetical protein